MQKYGILLACFLVTTSLPTLNNAQAQETPAGSEDVAQLLYKVNKKLLLQQRTLKKNYEGLLTAHENYVDGPSDKTYQQLLNAAKADEEAIKAYGQLVADAKKVEAQIKKAEQTYYEETPATKVEIEKGPVGKDTPPEGESVESEIPIPPSMLVNKLEQEIKDNGGIHSSFAEQLKTQMKQLKSVKDRIDRDLKSDAVKSNPAAKNEDVDLKSILEKAINARRKALREK